MPRVRKRKTKKFLEFYGPEYVEKFEGEKRRRDKENDLEPVHP